ncbi:hypothetical protein AVEN_73452-1 [Araneus ventricosus]|uniref:Uncharacterized protein n=1 Tax=Araneus ventricosus TaxID=182803 RepID=A0A4Y2LW58_ARAVE|nr:hypothetical protein AVEN_73452-1 [Araneus ventricosus]
MYANATVRKCRISENAHLARDSLYPGAVEQIDKLQVWTQRRGRERALRRPPVVYQAQENEAVAGDGALGSSHRAALPEDQEEAQDVGADRPHDQVGPRDGDVDLDAGLQGVARPAAAEQLQGSAGGQGAPPSGGQAGGSLPPNDGAVHLTHCAATPLVQGIAGSDDAHALWKAGRLAVVGIQQVDCSERKWGSSIRMVNT